MLNVIGKLVAWFYHLLFDRADQRAAVRASEGLTRDIKREWASLLSIHNGKYRAMPGEKLRPAFDYAKAIFDFDDFDVEVTRGRGEIAARVSTKSAPDSWMDLASLVYGNDYQQSQASTLPELACLLEEKWLFISSQLSSQNFSATQQTVRDVANEALERARKN